MKDRTELVKAAPGRIVVFPPTSANPGLKLIGTDLPDVEPTPPQAIKIGQFERGRLNAGDLVLAESGARPRSTTDTQLRAQIHTTEKK